MKMLDEDVYWERETEARREALEDERLAWIEDHTSDELCECGRRLMIRRYKYGADADGNRWEWREERYCPICE